MLTRDVGGLRDWALFAALALVPTVAVGGFALRALADEEQRARREIGFVLAAAAADASRDLTAGSATAAAELERLPGSADAGRVAAVLARATPSFASAVVLAPDRSLAVPAPLRVDAEPSPSPRPAAPASRCRELVSRLTAGDASSRAAVRRELLDGCTEATSPSGRLLWGVVALDDAARGLVSADAIAGWLEAHASRLSAPEREATRLDLMRVLEDGPAKARALAALAGSSSRREVLAAELASASASAALRGPPSAGGLVRWAGEGAAGILRVLDDGRLAGFVVDAPSLEAALAARAFVVPSDVRASVARVATPGDLRADAAVAPDLVLRFVPADDRAVARLAARSRRVLGALGIVASAVAFALAAALFARMRAARRSSALRTDFVAAVSHELRTPIASMRMLAELLEQRRVEPGEEAEVHEALAREARRLGETVERLLSFSRMAAGRLVLDAREEPVASVVAAAIDTFEERHADFPRVERDLDPDARASIDAGQVRLAVDNLLGNARKYAPAGTPYRVTVRRDGAGVAVSVADKGPGIARRDRARIFEPFERADDRLSRATEGTGIGLSLVRHVARAHGGKATVESEEGRGASFTLWLPANENRSRR